MNEVEWDMVFEILEAGYYKALQFAQEECLDGDEDSFKSLFKERMRINWMLVNEVMVKRALQEKR